MEAAYILRVFLHSAPRLLLLGHETKIWLRNRTKVWILFVATVDVTKKKNRLRRLYISSLVRSRHDKDMKVVKSWLQHCANDIGWAEKIIHFIEIIDILLIRTRHMTRNCILENTTPRVYNSRVLCGNSSVKIRFINVRNHISFCTLRHSNLTSQNSLTNCKSSCKINLYWKP